MDSSSSTSPPDPKNKTDIIFDWAHTECKLFQWPILPTRKLPDDCRETNSLLIDRDNSTATDGQIFELFKDTAIGASFRPQRKYLQLFFPDVAAAEQALADGPYKANGHTLPVFLPKGKIPPRLIFKLRNVPIIPRATVEYTVREALGTHVAVIEAVPYTIIGTHFATSRCEVVIEP